MAQMRMKGKRKKADLGGVCSGLCGVRSHEVAVDDGAVARAAEGGVLRGPDQVRLPPACVRCVRFLCSFQLKSMITTQKH